MWSYDKKIKKGEFIMNNENINLLKVRHDTGHLELEYDEKQKVFHIKDRKTSPWIFDKGSGGITHSQLRKTIEPWLTSLFQSEHLSLLVGSGLSYAAAGIARKVNGNTDSGGSCDKAAKDKDITNDNNLETKRNDKRLSANIMNAPILEEKDTKYAKLINQFAKKSAEKNKRGSVNIEDNIRVINDLLRGLEILGHNPIEEDFDESSDVKKEDYKAYQELDEKFQEMLNNFVTSVIELESEIANVENENYEVAFNYLVSFLMSFASRTGTRERLNIFTTNYDRLIEAGAEIAGLRLIDRFVGMLSPIFRSTRLDIDMHYNPPGIRGEPRYLEGVVKFTKLHGSLDWICIGDEIRRIGLPFGVKDFKKFLEASGFKDKDVKRIMIYPNSAKDRETAEYPYVELFRDFAAALCRPNSTLVTYGFGFGDEHINRIIKDMLTIPSTHLVVISYSDIDSRIMNRINEFGRPSQISYIIGKNLADIKVLVDYFLPNPSIDRFSIRMSEILRRRYFNPDDRKTDNDLPIGDEPKVDSLAQADFGDDYNHDDSY